MDTSAPSDLSHRLRQILSEHGGVRLAILFGSQATGRATPHSDLDLAVQMAVPLTAADKIALVEKFAQSCWRTLAGADSETWRTPLGQRRGCHAVKKDPAVYIRHIHDCILRIEAYVEEGRAAFFNDHKTQDAVIRNLEVMAIDLPERGDPN